MWVVLSALGSDTTFPNELLPPKPHSHLPGIGEGMGGRLSLSAQWTFSLFSFSNVPKGQLIINMNLLSKLSLLDFYSHGLLGFVLLCTLLHIFLLL